VILLVVVVLLTLFAIVGLTFVLYAESQATSSRVARETETLFRADEDPDTLLGFFLNQLIYDVNDIDQNSANNPNPGVGVYSALRGHSLARSMYGWTGAANTSNVPYNGVGRLHDVIPAQYPEDKSPIPAPFGTTNQDRYNYINYTYFPSLGDNLRVRDPERLSFRASPTTSYNAGTNAYAGGANVPYTYPDHNNMFLAAVRADGTVLLPSFHRPWIGTGATGNTPQGFGSLYANVGDPVNAAKINWNWFIPSKVIAQYPGNPNVPTDPCLKYFTLRPRPVDQLLPSDVMTAGQLWPPNYTASNRTNFFPPPEDAGGDVKNLTGNPPYIDPATGLTVNNDSIWIDLGAPVMVAPDGRKYKPLFAPLIIDLDGRVNLNVHGNIRAVDTTGNPAHASNQGWGPWEINLGRVFTLQPNPPEWTNLFRGNNQVVGRYGSNQVPGTVGQSAAIPGTALLHYYGKLDYDGCQFAGGTYTATGGPLQLPNPASGSYSPFPTFPTPGYDNGSQTNPGGELLQHPLLYDYFASSKLPPNNGPNRAFRASQMEALLRYGDTGSPALNSELFQLCPTNFAQARVRGLVTTHSMDVDRLGLVPWVWAPDGSYQLSSAAGAPPYPRGPQLPFPPQSALGTVPLPTPPQGSDFGPDWRAAAYLTSTLGRLDLNQPLTPYPQVGGMAGTGRMDTAQYQTAQEDRQKLARKIFNRLCAAVGAINPLKDPGGAEPTDTSPANTDPNLPTPITNSDGYDALRWLAQLAVNMVDYIDDDDISTPFMWNPPIANDPTLSKTVGNWWVFGTELPWGVINEVYAEVVNDPMDPHPGNKATTFNKLNFWVELHNPMSNDPTLTESGAARLQVPDNGAMVPAYGAYQLVISATPTDPSVRDAKNVLGDPDMTKAILRVADFSPAPAPAKQPMLTGDALNIINPSNGVYPPAPLPDQDNKGFYVLGPTDDFPADPNPNPPPPNATLRVQVKDIQLPAWPTPEPAMGYHSSMTSQTSPPKQFAEFPHHSLFLRRLANPYLPFQPDPTQYAPDPMQPTVYKTTYNPYVTVDYVQDIQINDGLVYNPTGPENVGNPGQPKVVPQDRVAYGRKQPYSATPMPNQQPDNPGPNKNEPQHTFFRHNGQSPNPPQAGDATLTLPFDWLVQPDRQLISPMELLHVSGFKPQELTQQFIVAGNKFQHNVRWDDPDNRLYRIFDYFKTHELAAGVAGTGRIPGKININSIWDKEIFYALCSAVDQGTNPNPNGFDNKTVDTIFQQLLALRSPNVPMGGGPGPTDRPFRGMAVPYGPAMGDQQYPGGAGSPFNPNGIGIDDSYLRPFTPAPLTPGTPPPLPLAQRLFEVPQAAGGPALHPYQKMELLTKIYNNLTTRSHVFAVWVTVGFFEVIGDDSTRPVKLGAEIGRAENRQVRHKMFAIVDRSVLTNNPGPQSKFDPRVNSPGTSNAPGAATRVVLYYSIIQ
jgi:hypothetical protein